MRSSAPRRRKTCARSNNVLYWFSSVLLLAQVLRLRGALLRVFADGSGLHGVHPCHAFDERRDACSERGDDGVALILGRARQADQERCGQRIRIETLRGKDASGAEGAREQRLAVRTLDRVEARPRHFVGGGEARSIGHRVDRRERLEPCADGMRRGGLRRGVRDGNHAEL